MSWQAQLYIGVPVATYAEVRATMLQLGGDAVWKKAKNEELFWDLPSVKRNVNYKGIVYEVRIGPRHEVEGGMEFPTPKGWAPYTDALVGFALTSRYAPAILDQGNVQGRPEPFVFDPLELADLLAQVRAWWPEAQAMIWNIWY